MCSFISDKWEGKCVGYVPLYRVSYLSGEGGVNLYCIGRENNQYETVAYSPALYLEC